MVPVSVLDLAPIVVGASAADAFRNTLDLARHAERWGFKRYWLAEHHNMPGVASAATSVVIAYVAAGSFPHDVIELQSYFRDPAPSQSIRAVPGAGLHVPIWLLGSSLFSAQ